MPHGKPYEDNRLMGAVGTLVCVPGVNSGPYLFMRAMQALGNRWRVVCVQAPGVNGVPLALPFTAKSYARYVWDVLDRLDIEGKVVLLGHSLGGFCVQEMVRMAPQRVSRAILVSTGRGQPDMARDLMKFEDGVGQTFWMFQKLMEKDSAAAHKALMGPRFVVQEPQAFKAFIDARLANLPPQATTLAQLGAGALFSSASWVHKIVCPVLVIHGTEDVLVRLESGRALAAALPNGRLLELFGVGHFPMLEHPDFWRYVHEFAEGHVLGAPMEPRRGLWQRIKGYFSIHG